MAEGPYATANYIDPGAIALSPDAKGIVYPTPSGNTDNLCVQHLDGSPGKQLTNFKREFIRDSEK